METPKPTLAEIERRYILVIYNECGFNKTKAAQVLGIGGRTLQRKLKRYFKESKTPDPATQKPPSKS